MYEKDEKKKLKKRERKDKDKEEEKDERESSEELSSSYEEKSERKKIKKKTFKEFNNIPIKNYKLRSIEREKKERNEAINEKDELVIRLSDSEISEQIRRENNNEFQKDEEEEIKQKSFKRLFTIDDFSFPALQPSSSSSSSSSHQATKLFYKNILEALFLKSFVKNAFPTVSFQQSQL
jgi:hypothetical protein